MKDMLLCDRGVQMTRFHLQAHVIEDVEKSDSEDGNLDNTGKSGVYDCLCLLKCILKLSVRIHLSELSPSG